MSAGFAFLCLGALALVAALSSALAGAGLALGRARLRRLTPAAQARVLLAAAFAPGFAGLALLSGWVVDLCVLACDHHHCLRHSQTWPSSLVVAAATAALVRVGAALIAATRGVVNSRRTRRALDAAALRRGDGVAVLPIDEPQAFVLGLWRPRVYVSRGLLAAAGAQHVESVLAHERAHARRRDPLRRWIAALGLALHLPGIGAALDHALARAQELAADADAARSVGDAPRIAAALVRLARLRLARPVATAAWHGGDLEARVRALLDGGAQADRPSAAAVAGAAVALWSMALLAADPLHRLGETLLDLLGR